MDSILYLDSKVYNNANSIPEKLQKMSHKLLNETVLYINGEKSRICEIEYYLKNSDHNDPFVHGDKDQGTPLRWYFHKMGKNYKAGTYKGLDLTFGYKNKGKDFVSYGGILIRSIKPENKDLIEGPCKVVNYILSKNGYSEDIEGFVSYANKEDGVKSDQTLNALKCSKLYCSYEPDKFEDKEICYGPRVGLTLKKKGPGRNEYLMADYRHLIYSDKIKKYKNTIAVNLVQKGIKSESVQKRVSVSKKNLDNYLQLFKDGKTKTYDEFYGVTLKSKDLLNLYGLSKK